MNNQALYYAVNRSEFHDRILIDEITKANETRQKREKFVANNNIFHK